MADLQSMTFEPHGNFVLRSRGRVLRVDAWGPWNLECTTDYARCLLDCARELPRPFAILAVSHIQPILSPEAEAVLQDNVRGRVALGCVAQATVLQEQPGLLIARSRYERMYLAEGIPHELFNTIADAQRWLNQLGFADALHAWHDDAAGAAVDQQRWMAATGTKKLSN
jgi:hypothetical protein